jgi:formylglycine-generating enzyme required for sulfatase activity
MGSNDGFTDEKPEHMVHLNSFWIAQTEVTNSMYRLCIDAAVCRRPSRTDYYSRDASSPEYPVVFVSWNDARTYCEWTGARLPTEAEWEKASRGENGLIYPWGNKFECQRGNFDDEVGEDVEVVDGGPNCDGYNYIAPVGSFLSGKSIYGGLDMAGNVWEWVADWYGDSYYFQYTKTSSPDPTGPSSGTRRVVKGGAWLNDRDVFFRASNRYSYPPELVDDNVGFRCAYSEK